MYEDLNISSYWKKVYQIVDTGNGAVGSPGEQPPHPPVTPGGPPPGGWPPNTSTTVGGQIVCQSVAVENIKMRRVSLTDPRGVDVAGYPGKKYMHLNTASPSRYPPDSIPVDFDPFTLTVKPGYYQIGETEYNELLIAGRDGVSHDPDDYLYPDGFAPGD